MEAANDERTVRAAAFLAQALDLDAGLDPHDLASDFVRLQDEAPTTVFAAELESSVGPAAFLVYVYALAGTDADGRTGREVFDGDLAILETAAQREAPGPRLLAHALGNDEGYILATTPATFRALNGASPDLAVEPLAAGVEDLLPTGDIAKVRADSAEALLRLLKLANAEATRWLGALQTDGRPGSNEATDDRAATIAFNDAETELALFLLDERSIQSLLRSLNLLLTAARQGADHALGREGGGDG